MSALSDSENLLIIQGNLSLDTAAGYLEQGISALDATDRLLQVGLEKAVFNGTAGIAVLVGLFRHARGLGKSVEIVSYPPELLEIAHTCGVLDVLGLSETEDGQQESALTLDSEGAPSVSEQSEQ